MGDWIQSFSGRVVTPRDLRVDQVTFEDIAHSLAQKVRFTGQLRKLGYSVAQHCVIGAEQIAGPFKLAFLLHEVSEVYLPDIPAPLKPFVSVDVGTRERPCVIDWTSLEQRHADAVLAALGLSSIRSLLESEEVHAMDLRMLMTEKRDLASPEPQPWGIDVAPLDIKITGCWSPAAAECAFTDLFHSLTRP